MHTYTHTAHSLSLVCLHSFIPVKVGWLYLCLCLCMLVRICFYRSARTLLSLCLLFPLSVILWSSVSVSVFLFRGLSLGVSISVTTSQPVSNTLS